MTTAYATYTFYTGTYLGTAITSSDFSRLILRASEIVDQITYNRAAAIVTAATDTTTIAAIQNAACAIAEQYQLNEESVGGGIQSETVGRHSVTYGPNSWMSLPDSEKLTHVARKYLVSTGLMYAGFLEGEYADKYGCYHL